MAITSMTGFARAVGNGGALQWQWELRSVNGKGLDLRLRLPAGFEHLDGPVRTRLLESFHRGNIQVALNVTGHESEPRVTINAVVLEQLVKEAEALRKRLGGPAVHAEHLLALRGVIDIEEAQPDETKTAARDAGIMSALDDAISGMRAMRQAEGTRLQEVIASRLQRIAELTAAAESNPARQPEAIRARLLDQVAKLAGQGLDPDRLHQEAVLLATRADITEEIDRLKAHIAAARDLLAADGAVGRKFDFLAQEFNREANTLCAKANDKSLTGIGLDLKTLIDQLREQVQNIE